MEVWRRAKKLHPQRKPVLAFVPTDDILCYGSKREMKLSDLAGAWNVTDREMREIWKGLRRIRSVSPKLSDIAGSRTISEEDWQNAQRVIQNAETSTSRGRKASLLMNESLRRRPAKGQDSTKVIRYWRNRRLA
jgi:hypothetical protein